MAHPQSAVHRTVLVVDVEGFGDPRRTNPNQVAVRAGLYRSLRHAFAAAGISWEDCDQEDRGDSVFCLHTPDAHKGLFVESLPHALAKAVRLHNSTHPDEEQIRLRMALHAGEINYDEHGATGAAINMAFRLLEAPQLKKALAASTGVLALIVSSWFFDEVVRNSPIADPATYRRITIEVKETTTQAWMSLPDRPYPPDEAILAAKAATEGARQSPTAHVPHQLPARPQACHELFADLVGRVADQGGGLFRRGGVEVVGAGELDGFGVQPFAGHLRHPGGGERAIVLRQQVGGRDRRRVVLRDFGVDGGQVAELQRRQGFSQGDQIRVVEEEVGRQDRITGGVDAEPLLVRDRRRVLPDFGEQASLTGVVGHGGGEPHLVTRAEAAGQRGHQQAGRGVRDDDGPVEVVRDLVGEQDGVILGRRGRRAGHVDGHRAMAAFRQGLDQRLEPGGGMGRAVH